VGGIDESPKESDLIMSKRKTATIDTAGLCYLTIAVVGVNAPNMLRQSAVAAYVTEEQAVALCEAIRQLVKKATEETIRERSKS
jgi:hypothetical protein